MVNVGIDLHKTQFTTCIIRGGEVLGTSTKYEMSNEGYSSFASFMHDQFANEEINLAIESTGNSRFFRDTMLNYGFNVCVVNTLQFKVVNLSTNKTDKNDARTLAEFLEKKMLPQSHLCSAKSEGLRRVLKCRSLLVQNQVALKNQAHAVLLAYGINTVPAQFQSKKSRQTIINTTSPELSSILQAIFSTLDSVESQIKSLLLDLKRISEGIQEIELLLTIPGVGIVNACTIYAYIDDIARFEDYKHFSGYCGLVPWVQSSNNSSYYGSITKRGPQELRTALVQCVVAMVRMPDKTGDTNLMRNYTILKENKNSGKAIIATARKLSRIIYVMLTQMIPFDPALA